MTVEAASAGPRVGPAVDAALNLKTGGICLIVGAVVFAIWRLLHGDAPAADAEAALNFVRDRPIYPTVHMFALLAALVVVTGLLGLTRPFDRPGSWLIGQAAVVSAPVGLAISGRREHMRRPGLTRTGRRRFESRPCATRRICSCRPGCGGSHSQTLSGGDCLDDWCSTPAAWGRDGA
jgi:hypothetical protein